jgi:cobalamin biosynthesis protein CobT
MLNPFELQRYIQTCANKGNLRVVYENVQQPRTDGHTVWLPRVDMFTTPEEARVLKTYVTHEANHVNFSDFDNKDMRGVDASTSLLGAIWNALEDNRIDRIGGLDYEGDRLDGDFTYTQNIQGIVEKAPLIPQEQLDAILPILALDAHTRNYYPSGQSTVEALEEAMSPLAKERWAKMQAGGYEKDVYKAGSVRDKQAGTAATFDLASRIFEEVYEQDAQKEKERCNEQHDKDSKPGEKRGAGNDRGSGKGQPTEGAAETGSETGGEEGKGRFSEADYSELVPDTHTFNRTRQGMHINYSKSGSGKYVACTKDEFKVTDYTKGAPTNTYGWAKPEFEALERRVSPGFANQVRARLQIRSRSRIQYGMKKGKLDSRSIHRCTLGDVPIADKLFKKKIVSDTLDVAVSILVDASGSMSGEKYSHAMVSAHLLSEAIGNTLHIPTEILCFSDYGSVTTMFVIRKHEDKLLSRDLLVNRMADVSHHMSANADGEAILFTYDRLLKRREKRRLMVVLSDGSPSAGRGGDIMWYTKKVVEQIQKDKKADIVGIGIMDRNVTLIYKEHYVISDCAQLETALLKLIDKKVI